MRMGSILFLATWRINMIQLSFKLIHLCHRWFWKLCVFQSCNHGVNLVRFGGDGIHVLLQLRHRLPGKHQHVGYLCRGQMQMETCAQLNSIQTTNKRHIKELMNEWSTAPWHQELQGKAFARESWPSHRQVADQQSHLAWPSQPKMFPSARKKGTGYGLMTMHVNTRPDMHRHHMCLFSISTDRSWHCVQPSFIQLSALHSLVNFRQSSSGLLICLDVVLSDAFVVLPGPARGSGLDLDMKLILSM